MAEYIERETLIKDIGDSVRFSSRNGVSAEMRGATKIVDRIVSAPTVYVVKVVRCKDCDHYNTSCCADGFGWCEKHNRGEMDEHYCSYGEAV